MVLFSPRFAPDRDVANDTRERYGQSDEIRYYEALSFSGFYEPEAQSFISAKKLNPTMKSALVIGCGTGREAFALAKKGLEVTAVDFCEKMISKANELNEQSNEKVFFTSEKPTKRFDLVLVTYGLTNHILSYEDRIATLKSFASYYHDKTVIMFSGYYRKINFGDRFWIASQILRLRWFGKKEWRPGLTVISHFGFHNDESIPLPFHFYREEEEIINELKESGLNVHKVPTVKEHPLSHYPNFFVATLP